MQCETLLVMFFKSLKFTKKLLKWQQSLTQHSNSPRFKHEAFFPSPCFDDDTVGGWVQLVVDAVSLAEGHFFIRD